MYNYVDSEVFYLSPVILDSEAGVYLNSRFSIFRNEIEKWDSEYNSYNKSFNKYTRVYESTFFYSNNPYHNKGSFFQLFIKNNEFYFRFILEYSCCKSLRDYSPSLDNTIQMGYTDKVSNITYGSLLDKIDKIYRMRCFHILDESDREYFEWCEKEEGSFSVGLRKDNIYYDTHEDIKNCQLQDTHDVVIIYLGKDKDYYFASTDLKIYNNYFCIEAISNNNEKFILKSDFISRYRKINGSADEIFIDDRMSYSGALFNHNLIAEKLENSDVATEEFTLQHDLERMSKINEFLQNDRSVIDNKCYQYLWNSGEKQQGTSIHPIEAAFEGWLDAVHEAGLDDNDLD